MTIKPNFKFKYILQKFYLKKRDDDFWTYKQLKLNWDIAKDTYWLNTITYFDGKSHSLPFYEQAIKYFEYKNMIIQRRSQYVIIFLTLVLLIMTGFQIYLNFFN